MSTPTTHSSIENLIKLVTIDHLNNMLKQLNTNTNTDNVKDEKVFSHQEIINVKPDLSFLKNDIQELYNKNIERKLQAYDLQFEKIQMQLNDITCKLNNLLERKMQDNVQDYSSNEEDRKSVV